MSEFVKYMHVERYGTEEVQGIDIGDCYIFPKLDGTNASTWFEDGNVSSGSRNRKLSIESDNAGFCAYVATKPNIQEFHRVFPHLRLNGEWLVPHSLKTYRDEAWQDFYVFDVYDHSEDKYVTYDVYKGILDLYNINYIAPLCIIKNPSYESLLKEAENNRYLIKDGEGIGEGIVIKNYEFKNRFGRVCWAKIITNQFKEKHYKEMGAPVKEEKKMVEQDIVDEFVTLHLVDKTYDKIRVEIGEWASKYIPRLLQTVYYDLITEELWEAIKKHRNPSINFKTLNTLCITKIKQLKPEIF